MLARVLNFLLVLPLPTDVDAASLANLLHVLLMIRVWHCCCRMQMNLASYVLQSILSTNFVLIVRCASLPKTVASMIFLQCW